MLKPEPIATGVFVPFRMTYTALPLKSATYKEPSLDMANAQGVMKPEPITSGVPVPLDDIFLTEPVMDSAT